ncbi:MAG: argininosuccinate lyase [Nitrospirota bacterium]|nr:argininosuccinate lyase [Nitrospirota bacterium]
MQAKPWGGRFTEATDKFVEEFTASIDFDQRLWKHDIMGSIAHAKMLAKQGIISAEDEAKITSGLEEIYREVEEGKIEFSVALEDIHMNVESRLVEKIGDAGKRLHTGRSRNDQVALDIRFYMRDEISRVRVLIKQLQKGIVGLAEAHIDCIMPGFTHLQPAQPVLLSHHLLAYYEMFKRDLDRFEDCFRRTNVLPLGSGALAGTTFPIDRRYTAELTFFPDVTRNSMDSVSDRDFAIDFCAASAILMMHLSRLSEELIIWASAQFGFVDIPDAYCTGSSIMPQKKNPDVPELVRGKTGRAYGNLMALLTLMKSLPLAYNKDMQEDKEPLFDTVDTVKGCLTAFVGMLPGLKFNKERMRRAALMGFTTATDLADYLVRKNLPFRDAHEVVGKAVRYCIEQNKGLEEMTLEEFRKFSDLISDDVFAAITLEASVNARKSEGGTATEAVKARIKELYEAGEVR